MNIMNVNKKLAVALTISLITVVPINGVFAHNNHSNADQVFDQQTTNKLIEQSKDIPVQADKKSDSSNINPKLSLDSSSSLNSFISGGGSGGSDGSGGTMPASYPTRKGVILVTHDTFYGLPLGHSAIIYSQSQVVESVSNGVVVGRNDWYSSKSSCEAGSVISTTSSQDAAAANWCYSQLGKPYNYNYFNINTRSSFYCSQLVWASFYDNFKINLNTSAYSSILGNPVHPVELLSDNAKTSLVYKQNW